MYDANDWNPTANISAPLPGFIVQLAVIGDDDLWAACRVERKWWQPWLPKERIKWVRATNYLSLPPSATSPDGG